MTGRVSHKVCVVTGTRAEYGLLFWVLKEICAHPGLTLQLVVTGMHLSPEFGLTWKGIEADGFAIDAKVEMLLSSDTGAGIGKSIGLGTIGFADAFERLAPDLVVLWGDRFEALAAAQAALVAGIPIAHLGGGDVTEGAFDDSIRHAISKMANLHFPICPDSARRLRQLGEDPANIFEFGSAGLDHLRRTPVLEKAEVERRLEFTLRPRNLLVTYHPATRSDWESRHGLAELLAALESLGPETGLIITKPNADNESRAMIAALETFAQGRDHVALRTSLGSQLYLSTARLADAVVGNSSSGVVEIPSLGISTVDIGLRQKGRAQAPSVIHCEAERGAILAAIGRALALDCKEGCSPYGDGSASPRIVAALGERLAAGLCAQKAFIDLAASGQGVS